MVVYPNATASQIAEIVKRSDLGFCEPTSDHCRCVAIVLDNLFDTDGYYVAIEPAQRYTRPAHVAVIVDGQIIDSTGIVSEEYMKDYAISGLKSDEVSEADWGEAGLGLFDKMNLNEGETQLLNDIKNEIKKVSEDVL
jgi:hypothetical protein